MHHHRLLLPVILAATAGLLASATPGQKIKDFSFLQISDIHVEARFDNKPRRERGAETFTWLAEQLRPGKGPWGKGRKRPAFLVATGDLTEFGVPGTTWETLEALMKPLGLPWYAVPGNHDNTWVAMGPIMRERHGGWNYSFDHGGCHFVVINSATIQEPVPSLERGTLRWLAKDLEKAGERKPVFLFMHHPPRSREFAQPTELRLLLDVLDLYNVVMLGYGHGHSPTHEVVGGIDCVQGGTTFAKGRADRRGCNRISVKNGRLRVVYHYVDKAKGTVELLNKKIGWREPLWGMKLEELKICVHRNKPALYTVVTGVFYKALPLHVLIDGRKIHTFHRRRGEDCCTFLNLEGLVPGAHLVSVEGNEDGRPRQRSRVFHLPDPKWNVLWRHQLEAGVKAPMTCVDGRLLVATLGGRLLDLKTTTGKRRFWTGRCPEILAAPLSTPHGIVLADGDGRVRCLTGPRKQRWVYDARAPVYGSLILKDDTLYFGDLRGYLHAVEAATGKRVWTFFDARYAVETAPLVTADRVIFGAWDGFLYALERATGRLTWKAKGPRSRKSAARYYAPADCPPVFWDGRIVAVDRGYWMGAYDARGAFTPMDPKPVAAIAASPDGRHLNLRGVDSKLTRLGPGGRVVWSVKVPLGRFPIPPVEVAGRIIVLSNRGRLSVVDARTGRILGAYRATAGTYVMAPPAVGPDGTIYVADMQGVVTALRLRRGL